MNNNGWTKFLAKALWIAIWACILGAYSGGIILTQHVIANDKDSRTRDDQIKERVEVKIDELRREQMVMRKEANQNFTEILVTLEGLKKPSN